MGGVTGGSGVSGIVQEDVCPRVDWEIPGTSGVRLGVRIVHLEPLESLDMVYTWYILGIYFAFVILVYTR
jgi:hypothetical protein